MTTQEREKEIFKLLRDFKVNKYEHNLIETCDLILELCVKPTIEEKTVIVNNISEMQDALRMCQFSGYSPNPDEPTRKCSRSETGPMTCSTCRVAADWEECYG